MSHVPFHFRSGTLHSAEGAYGIIKDVSQNGTSQSLGRHRISGAGADEVQAAWKRAFGRSQKWKMGK